MGLATFLSVIILQLSLPVSDEREDQGKGPSEPRGLLRRFHH